MVRPTQPLEIQMSDPDVTMDLAAELDAMVEAEAQRKQAGRGKKSQPTKPGQRPVITIEPPEPEHEPVPRALRRIAFTRRHLCPTCGGEGEFVAAMLLEVEVGSRYVRRMLEAGWEGYEHLPLEVESLDPMTVPCPSCLRGELHIDAILAGRGYQMILIN